MNNIEMLTALKVDLGITTNAYDSRLVEYLDSAQAAIRREGITLTSSTEDGNLVVSYAGWIWNRRKTGEGMPRMLRWQMNNRLFSEKLSGVPQEPEEGDPGSDESESAESEES
jgi:hypothetical protein